LQKAFAITNEADGLCGKYGKEGDSKSLEIVKKQGIAFQRRNPLAQAGRHIWQNPHILSLKEFLYVNFYRFSVLYRILKLIFPG
jgi:hypothetical protein